jgi:hypothetical protein
MLDKMGRLTTSYLRGGEEARETRGSERSRRARDMRKREMPVLPEIDTLRAGNS